MSEKEEQFEEYKILHAFMHPLPMKSWITADNYQNHYKNDFNTLFEVVARLQKDFKITYELGQTDTGVATCTIGKGNHKSVIHGGDIREVLYGCIILYVTYLVVSGEYALN